MSFTPRNSPINGNGCQSFTAPANTGLLSSLVIIPDDANAARVQCVTPGEPVCFSLDGTVGRAGVNCMRVRDNAFLDLTNRQQIELCVLTRGGGTGSCVVQFFTGQIGITQ